MLMMTMMMKVGWKGMRSTTNLFSRLLEGFLFEADCRLGCLVKINARLNQTEGGDPETTKNKQMVSKVKEQRINL